MSESDNPFEIFLGIKTDANKPDYGKVLGLELKTAKPEEIKVSFDKIVAKVRAQKPGNKTKEWAWLIDHLKRAQESLVAKAQKRSSSSGVSTPPKSSPSDKGATNGSPAKSGNVGTYAPPSTKSAAKKTPSETNSFNPPTSGKKNRPSDVPKKSETKSTSRSLESKESALQKPSSKKSATKESGKANVALPPSRDKTNPAKKKTPDAKTSSKTEAAKSDSTKSKTTKSGTGKPDAFTLDAPDQNDSFDSDTQFSASSFNSAAITANTIDPMAPVDDPTENWGTYDVSQIDKYGMIATAAVATQAKPSKSERATPQANDELSVQGKTFYGESYRKKSKVGVMIGGTLLAMLIVGGISYGIIFGFKSPEGEKVAEGEGDNKSDKKADDNEPAKPDNEPAKEDDSNESKEKQNDNLNSEDTQPDKSGDSQMPKKDDSDTAMEKDEKKEPEKSDDQTPPKKEEPDVPKKGDDDPEMKKKEPETPKPKSSDVAELARLLTEIRLKLNQREFVDANRLLDKAQKLPVLPDHKLKLDRLVQINDLYQKFWNSVVEGCGNLKALDEIKFSDTNIVKVVESSEEKIIYRALGQRFEKEPRELQIGLAMKIAEKEMDIQSAEGRIIKGAVFAIESVEKSDLADQAREVWEEAKLVGGETDELILFLDDSYEDLLASVIKREKVPSEEDAAKAQERFREKYGDALKTAARNQKAAGELAKQLLKDVPTLDDAADRHANFTAAIFYAGKNGNVELVMSSLSDMNKWFSIDLEEETLNALVKVNKNRLKPEQKREIARTAFEYMDRAKAATNNELELKFAELALAAAKGTRDPKLVQAATREVQRVKAAMQSNN